MEKVKLKGIYLLLGIISLFTIAFMDNSLYILAGYATLILILQLTWRQNIPNVFVFIMIYHWLQVVSYIFYVNESWNGDLNQQTESSGKAYIVSLAGLIIMSFIFNRIAYKQFSITTKRFEQELALINPQRVMLLYLVLYFISNILGSIAFSVSALTQVFINIALIKWAGFTLLGFIAVKNKSYRKFFIIAFALEFVSGFFSFFSSFKDVIFYTIIVALTFVKQVESRIAFRSLLVGAVLFSFALVWTIVKGDYREFLNNGTGEQVVVVSQDEAFTKLGDLVTSLNEAAINNGTEQLLYRLQYVFNLSKSMDMVPATIPYQNGAVWKSTITYISVPRFLNPGKTAYNASERATKYTGIMYAGTEQGTSFSLGYFADCYVDFGVPGMFLALAMIAWLWSRAYRFFLKTSSENLVFNYAVVAAFFVQFCYYESDGTFLLGRFFSTFVVFLLLKFTLFKNVGRYIYYSR